MLVSDREPWQMRPADFMLESEHHRLYHARYFDSAGNKKASSRLVPAEMVYPAGCWLFDDTFPGIYGHEIAQYRWLDSARVVPQEPAVFTNEEGRPADADRYAAWRRQGLVPPPIGVVEGHNGEWRITNGHRRWRAAQFARCEVPAWFSPRQMGRDGRYLITGLTYEVAFFNARLAGLETPSGELERIIRDVRADRYGMELPRQYPEFFPKEDSCPSTSPALSPACA